MPRYRYRRSHSTLTIPVSRKKTSAFVPVQYQYMRVTHPPAKYSKKVHEATQATLCIPFFAFVQHYFYWLNWRIISETMPYVNRDGTVGGRKPFLRLVTDFFQGIIDFIALFFGALTNPPQRIESRATVSALWVLGGCKRWQLFVLTFATVWATEQWAFIWKWRRKTFRGQQHQGCQKFRRCTGTNGRMRQVMPH